ncbi:cytochrome P450 [Naumannella sp. ID2617S]|nr:cytochrome P450 [Naumannella sp. ID2617S]
MTQQIPTLGWTREVTMEQLERNPYPTYERLRAESPLVNLPVLGGAVATTVDLCREVATSPSMEAVIQPAGGRTFGHPAVIGVNGDIHADLRSMVDPALQPSEVDRWVDATVRPLARRYLERFEDRGTAELVSEYFEPLSVRALGDSMGLGEVSSDKLREWFHALSVSFTNAGVDEDGNFLDQSRFEIGDRAKAEIRAVVDPLIDRWIHEPEDVSISHWLHDGMPEGQTRDREYIYPTIFVFLLGAMQEPGHAMASTMVGLFTDQQQLDDVVEDPRLIPQAIAEGLRWTAPIWSATSRMATEDTVIGDYEVPRGTVIIQSYGSANHDEGKWEAPSRYDMRRAPLPHLAFGFGNHACAGIHFANQVCRIGMEELFESIPNLTRDTDADVEFWGWGFRGPRELHVTWEV